MREKRSSKISDMLKYLFPQKGRWLARTVLLFTFIIFDYAVTLVFCSNPLQEGNLFVRRFMETYGIFLGLTIYDFINNLPIYMVLCIVSHTVDLPSRLSRIVEPCVDIVFAWFVAGVHFDGAASWFWSAPEILRQATGFSLYLIFAFILFVKANSLTTTLSRTPKEHVKSVFQCVAE